MTYISYSNICANIVRNCLKEPHKSDAIAREKVHFTVTKWSEGKPEKPSKIPTLNHQSSVSIRLDLAGVSCAGVGLS
ncbi:unnamed protein product [Linum tenue]|nr:unnamed protein product [Linum tenue]